MNSFDLRPSILHHRFRLELENGVPIMLVARNDCGQLEPGKTTPFRVGIWCDYEQPILPDEGIGVLVYNLVQGFLDLEEPVEVVLLVKPGWQKQVASFTGRHDRLRIASR